MRPIDQFGLVLKKSFKKIKEKTWSKCPKLPALTVPHYANLSLLQKFPWKITCPSKFPMKSIDQTTFPNNRQILEATISNKKDNLRKVEFYK